MKNMKWTLLSCMTLLICILALALPAVASNSGTVTVTGTVPLIIYDVQSSGITTSTAIISWKTNGPATSQVFYDTKFHANVTGYAYHSSLDNAPVMQHSVTLSGLSPSTTYHYRAKSTALIGSANFVAVSADFTFKTLSAHIAPTVTTVRAWPVLGTSALLWGSLDDKGSASSVVVYFQWGRTINYGSETSHQTLTRAHNIFTGRVTSLKKNTTYHFRAVAVGDGTSYGEDETFRTMSWPF